MAELLEQADPAAPGNAALNGGADGSTDYREVVEAFRQVAGAISDESDPDDLLHLIAAKICSLLSIRRCSVYLKDPETGLFHGQVAETGHRVDAAIKKLNDRIDWSLPQIKGVPILTVSAMTERGLKGVSNPSAIFLSTHGKPVAGSCVLATLEGSRPLLVEIQALVDSGGPSPRRLSVGLESIDDILADLEAGFAAARG